MILKKARYVPINVRTELWGRAAGRCQFNGCNKILYRSSVTQEQGNFSEEAHIYAFSEHGPRGHDKTQASNDYLNQVDNLLLVCKGCHYNIDKNKGKGYSVELLQKWKKEHEDRVAIVTGIEPNKRSHVIFYEGKIGEHTTKIHQEEARIAMFPNRYPVPDSQISLSMISSLEDNTMAFWETESEHLQAAFQQKVSSLIERTPDVHFSLFALAPMPLLIQLGTLLTDKINVDVYQLFREPRGWEWQEFLEGFEFMVKTPASFDGQPSLIISLSDIIPHERAKSVVGDNTSIWELTVDPKFIGNDNIRSKAQLSMFRTRVRELMIKIKKKHGDTTPLHIFPAMAISISVEMGRARMPKADMPWIIYDYNWKLEKSIKAMTIGE